MWKYPTKYEVIVVGAGHAGCEAAYAAAKMGAKTLLLTMNVDTIAKASCNPSIGGIGKGHIVREIDALGGIMGKIADRTAIHLRMLNTSKGPAVRAPRAQIDKTRYSLEMKSFLENTKNLEIKQFTVESLISENNNISGVKTLEGVSFYGTTIIICAGTFMKGLMHIGEIDFPGGRGGDLPSNSLSESLKDLGFKIERLKTGTPPRIHKRSIDFSKLDKQSGDLDVSFSYDKEEKKLDRQVPCYISYTTEKTKKIILRDLKKSALFSGKIQGVGPRYCPSIEDKIVRFKDKSRHQAFLEPEGIDTVEYYINGLSSSMPFSTQIEVIQSMVGLENAEIIRPAYAIEYDWAVSSQIYPTMETKLISGLYFAGQINGTTGYEEAAAQGLIAGINAANKVLNKDEFIPKREESYIGVMIDDLITKDIEEPYRMFTSRAEYRLLLRQDNADLRLREYGYHLNLINEDQHQKLLNKKSVLSEEISRLKAIHVLENNKTTSLYKLLSRPENTYNDLLKNHSQMKDFNKEINDQIELEIKYAGYISRQVKEIKKLSFLDKMIIPTSFSYEKITGLRKEAKEKLLKHLPQNLAMASRINGVSHADITILMVALKKRSATL